MTTQSRPFYIHVLLWALLVVFPVSFSGTGNVNLAQVLLHGVMAVSIAFAVLIVQFDAYPQLSKEAIRKCIVFVAGVIAYFAILTAMNPYTGTANDLMDVLRPLVYFMYFLVPFLIPLAEEQFARLLKFVFVMALLTVFVSALVYLPNLWPVVDVWKGRTSEDAIIFHFFRWSGTSGYPSDYSFFLSFFIYALLVTPAVLFSRRTDLLLLLVFGFAAAMTMSRGGIATIAVVAVIGSLMFRKLGNLLVLGIIGAIILAVLIWLATLVDISLINLNYVWGLLDRGFEADASASYRVNELALALEYAVSHFPFGFGAARDVITRDLPIVESLYGHYLIKWGVLGLAAYYLVTVYLLDMALRLERTYREPLMRAFGRAAFLLILSVPLIFGLSSAIADRFKGLPFFFLIAGYVAYFGIQSSGQKAHVPEAGR